jgi:hypothetical protein
VEDRLQALRERPESISSLTDAEKRHFLVRLDARRRLVLRLLAVETWLSDRQSAEADAAGG